MLVYVGLRRIATSLLISISISTYNIGIVQAAAGDKDGNAKSGQPESDIGVDLMNFGASMWSAVGLAPPPPPPPKLDTSSDEEGTGKAKDKVKNERGDKPSVPKTEVTDKKSTENPKVNNPVPNAPPPPPPPKLATASSVEGTGKSKDKVRNEGGDKPSVPQTKATDKKSTENSKVNNPAPNVQTESPQQEGNHEEAKVDVHTEHVEHVEVNPHMQYHDRRDTSVHTEVHDRKETSVQTEQHQTFGQLTGIKNQPDGEGSESSSQESGQKSQQGYQSAQSADQNGQSMDTQEGEEKHHRLRNFFHRKHKHHLSNLFHRKHENEQ